MRESLVSGYMSDNDYESALRILDNINSPSAEMLRTRQKVEFALGTSRYKAGETESALRLFSQAAASREPDALITRQALLWKANCLYDLGRWNEAADDYQKFMRMAPASDPNLTLARYNLAYTRLEQERYDEALTGFNRLTDAPDVSPAMRADVYNRTGDCLYYAERYNEAAERYRKAVEQVNPLLPRPLEALQIIGGGSNNRLLNAMTAEATGLKVYAGPSEATAIGNIMLQAITAGQIKTKQEVTAIRQL